MSMMGCGILYAAACLAILVVIFPSGDATACSNNGRLTLNSQECLSVVQSAAEDTSRYWFGFNYFGNCNTKSEFDSECYNPRSNFQDSLVSRIFQRRVYDRTALKTVLKVSYQTYSGQYKACGNTYRSSKSRLVEIDPTMENTNLTPFELKSQPMVSWEMSSPSSSSFYTLAIIDAGYVTVQALYVNIPGNSLDGGQTIVEYHSPMNPTTNNNPYVFVLFKQNSYLELQPAMLHQLSLRDLGIFENFLTQSNMLGPVGISWFTVRADPYSSDSANRSPGHMNTCAQFVDKALRDKNVPYLSQNRPPLNVYLDLTFKSPAFSFSCCCNKYSLRDGIFKPNPIGDGETEAGLMRFNASYVFHKSTAFPSRSRDFKGELHTMIMVDPFAPVSKERPYVHMLVTNIREGIFESGNQILPYMGPWPRDPYFHRYYFFLFKQNKSNFKPRPEDYAKLVCTGMFRGRCGFNMAALIKDGGLELVGSTWQRVKVSDYVRCVYANSVPQVGESMICPDVQGYTPGCRGKSATSASSYIKPLNSLINWLLVLTSTILINVMALLQ